MVNAGTILGLAMFALGLVIGSTAPAQAQKKVALLIGNNRYQHVPALKTAINDAHSLAEVLRKLGFSVIVAEDQSRRAMSEALLAFDKAVEPGDIAFFFFAGHGFEIRGQNYLLPVDVPAATEGQEELIRDSSFPAQRVVDRLQERGARTTILVLDACRNNPFERPGARAVRGTGGLAPMTPSEGLFILFSAGAKQLALDQLSTSDPNPNSVFTRIFAQQLAELGLTLVQIAKRTQIDVKQMAASVRHEQTPAYYDQVVGEVVLNAAPGEKQPAKDGSVQTTALPSVIDKQPGRPEDAPASAERGIFAELDALATAENWRELRAYLTNVKPTLRDNRWNALVEMAAIGELTPLANQSGGPLADRLAGIERYYPAFPSLRSSQRFLALRAKIGLGAFVRCFDEARAQPEVVRCRDELERFVLVPPANAEVARDAARIIGLKLHRGVAASFFAIALEAPGGELICADPDVTIAVVTALRWPAEWPHAKAALTLLDVCWDALKTEVVAEVARHGAGSDYVRNTCPPLMKRNALTGLRAAHCRELMAQ